MNKLRYLLACSIAAAGLAAAIQLRASGTYCACMPKPPSAADATRRVDRDKFDLGQKVFNGRTTPVQSDASAQQAKLEVLQERLPPKVAKSKNLTVWAGKLTAEQLDALEYYISQRYPKAK